MRGLRATRETGHITYHRLASRRPSKVIQGFCAEWNLKRKETKDVSALSEPMLLLFFHPNGGWCPLMVT